MADARPITEIVENLDPTPPLQCGDKPEPRRVPRAIRELIGELGLRYRPNERVELEAHAARLALLARDVADLPPRALRRAIDRWAVTKPWLPKAVELVELAKEFAGPVARAAPVPMTPEQEAAARNAALEAAGNFRCRWLVECGRPVLRDYDDWLELERPEEFARVMRQRWQWLQHDLAGRAEP